MAGRNECCRYEASLEELLADDIMQPVLQSAGYDRERFHDLMVETGERFRLSREADDDRD
jgi:hypothetical protein